VRANVVVVRAWLGDLVVSFSWGVTFFQFCHYHVVSIVPLLPILRELLYNYLRVGSTVYRYYLRHVVKDYVSLDYLQFYGREARDRHLVKVDHGPSGHHLRLAGIEICKLEVFVDVGHPDLALFLICDESVSSIGL